MNPTEGGLLPEALYTAAQVRELDRIAIQEQGIPGYTLMCRAGEAVFRAVQELLPGRGSLLIVCGGGNNAGDGYVVARLAAAAGWPVQVGYLLDPARLQGDAARAWQDARDAGVGIAPFATTQLKGIDLVVDALLGTGLQRPVGGEWAAAVDRLNDCGAPVLAVDLPSGLNADSGVAMGAAVRADVTLSFIGLKRGMFTGQGPELCGRLQFDGLEVPGVVYGAFAPSAGRYAGQDLPRWLAPRPRHAHKGRFGHVLVIGGDHGMAGAARLAAEAALRVGAGLVSLATRPDHAAPLLAGRPEIMSHGVADPVDLQPLLQRASVVAVGPGLGQSAWGRALWRAACATELPLVMDADALNLMADSGGRPLGPCVITPHPGEAGRLLGRSAADVESDRFAAAAALANGFGTTTLLKGHGSIVQAPGGMPHVVSAGNPGMASGGMGDVLTGVVAGLWAQGLDPARSALGGAYLHGRAADLAAADGERGLLASDLMPQLRRLANPDPVA
jgi:NAD(P)H-hydrate epimerase